MLTHDMPTSRVYLNAKFPHRIYNRAYVMHINNSAT